MFDKLLLNNQIITNKKNILKARTQTINKLVQKIRKLKTLNEKKPNNVKITEKLGKTPKIMLCVKKLKTVDIIRKILILSKKPIAILTNGRAPPEDIAVALLASNKILVNIVSSLRVLLHLDDNNPGWKDEIMELSKRKKKLLQGGKRKKEQKAEGKTKKHSPTKNNWKEENLPNNQADQIKDNENVASTSGWIAEPTEELTESMKSKALVGERVATKGTNKVSKKLVHSAKANEFIAASPSPENQSRPVTTVDSFFFTDTGDNYQSTVVIDRIQPETPDDGLIRRERRNNAIRPYQRNNNNRRQSVQNVRTEKRQSFASNVKPERTEEKLHPSWAAKEKLKPIITQFKGQKITFDDDGKDNTVKTPGKNTNKPSYQDRADEKQQKQDNLHPSWVAKQKLKSAITEFKGKKITFDE